MGSGNELFAAVDVVVGEGVVEDEVVLEGSQDFGQVGVGFGGELEVAVDDEPADVVGAGCFEGLLGGVGIGGGVEAQDWEAGGATGGVVEGVLAGEEVVGVLGWDGLIGVAD